MHNQSVSSTGYTIRDRVMTPTATTIHQGQQTNRSTTPSNRQITNHARDNPEQIDKDYQKSKEIEFSRLTSLKYANEMVAYSKTSVQLCA